MNIYPLFSWQFIGFFLFFLFSIYISFYLPGALVISRRKLELGLHILLSFCLGVALWGFQGYIFGFLHLRFLTYFYLGIVLLLSWRLHIFTFKPFRESFYWLKKHPWLSLFVVTGILAQLSAVIGSGVLYADGVRFFGVNRADGIMHVAFIQSIMHYFPPIEPGSYGHPITNYHYWSDMMIADLVRNWRLPITHTFFQYFPLFISALTALAAYQVIKVLGFSKTASVWAIFFLFFVGDATFALILIFLKKLSFATPALDNGAAQFLNMPNALARLIFLGGIIGLFEWLNDRKQTSWGLITIILFASLVGIKIYYGIFAILGLGLVTIFILIQTLQAKKWNVLFAFGEQWRFVGFGIIFCLVSLAIFLPANSQAGGLIWSPLEWPKIFLGTDVLNWGGWWVRLQDYQIHHNIPGLVLINAIAIIITLVCIHGTRVIGLLSGRNVYRRLGWEMSIFLLPGVILFHFLGLFTLQKSGGLNVFNFMVVATVVLSILSGMVLEKFNFSIKKPLVSFIIVLLILLSVPRVISEVTTNIQSLLSPKEVSFLVSNDELQAFNYIREKTPANYIVQSHPTNPQDYVTPYVAFFSDRLSYLSGVKLQETHNQPLSARESKLNEVFTSKSSIDFFGQARAAKINLLYIRKVKDEEFTYPLDPNLITKLFENNSTIVYRVNIYQ